MQEPPDRLRSVRSYVMRAGRITEAQQRALATLWPRYGVEFNLGPLDLARLFGRVRRAPSRSASAMVSTCWSAPWLIRSATFSVWRCIARVWVICCWLRARPG